MDRMSGVCIRILNRVHMDHMAVVMAVDRGHSIRMEEVDMGMDRDRIRVKVTTVIPTVGIPGIN